MSEPTLVVIGRQPCETSCGPIAVGEFLRLPVVEALERTHANQVTLGDWHEQQLTLPPADDPAPSLVDVIQDLILPAPEPRKRGRYRRRDLRAAE